ncbi:SiaB family protein kinase [Delftia acidovorans]|uniref:SiaB family protein kinase n=1 Tax=Delftia acidovorans TaxID=80866 RepID=UPI0030182380
MSPGEFAHLRAQAEHNGLLLYYAGTFNPNVIQAAADTLKCRLASEDGSSSAKRKLFSTFIEMAQNVLHYAAPLPALQTEQGHGSSEPVAQGAIGVGRIDAPAGAADAGADQAQARFWIACSNAVRREHVPRLAAKLDAVRAMSHPEIKAAYKAQLHNTDHSASDDISRGAGLGWLTIARDASAPLQYHIATGEDAADTAPHAVFHVKALI